MEVITAWFERYIPPQPTPRENTFYILLKCIFNGGRGGGEGVAQRYILFWAKRFLGFLGVLEGLGGCGVA